MSIETKWIRYGESEEFVGYAAWPGRAAPPLPAVIVLQEALGLDAHIEDVTRRVAAAGYAAFAPDLFARNGERAPLLTCERLAEVQDLMNAIPPGALADPAIRDPELARRPSDQAARLRETLAALFTTGPASAIHPAQYIPQMRATARHLRQDALTHGQKIGIMGFCMGGGLSAFYACHDPELAAAAIFYGMSPPAPQVPQIQCPVIGFYGATDARINEGVPGFAAAMQSAGKSFEVHTYQGAGHAFFNDGRNTYHAGAARDAFARLLGFFGEHLV